MSASISAAGLSGINLTVQLTSHSKHSHVPNPISPSFQPPNATQSLTFSPVALAAAVARTATTRNGRRELLAGLQKSALGQLECLVTNSATFELMPDFGDLADFEKTSFAARCGAGVTDLYMNAIGYTWRANAACLGKPLQPHADFIYDGGSVAGHGVVLAEAHGSFAANATAKTLKARAKSKYTKQVKPYVNVGSPYGHVIHGYCVAFGSKPGTSGAFLSLAETRVSKPKKKKGPFPPNIQPALAGGVPTPIALATHRSNFLLMGAWQIVDWIDWMIARREMPLDRNPVAFIRFPYAGRWYLASARPTWPVLLPPWWHEDFWEGANGIRRAAWSMLGRELFGGSIGWFIMEESACSRFLNILTDVIRDGGEEGPVRLELPTFDPVGFGIEERDRAPRPDHSDYNYALFRDGLALVTAPFRLPKVEMLRWSPREGFEG